MTLKLRLSTDAFSMYEFGRTFTYRIYNEDGSVFDATAPDAFTFPIVKCFKRPGDQALFFRDVAKAIEIIRNVAQIVADIDATWTTQNQGVGTWAFTQEKRFGVGGHAWITVLMLDSKTTPTKVTQTELLRVFVNPAQSPI